MRSGEVGRGDRNLVRGSPSSTANDVTAQGAPNVFPWNVTSSSNQNDRCSLPFRSSSVSARSLGFEARSQPSISVVWAKTDRPTPRRSRPRQPDSDRHLDGVVNEVTGAASAAHLADPPRLRHQREAFGMRGTDRREVTSIGRRDRDDGQPLGKRYDRSIHEPQGGVFRHQQGHASQVLR